MSEVVKAVQEVLEEMSTTAGMTVPSTPFAFSKKGQGKNVATKTAEKLGFKTVQRPKRPSNTRMIDYLDENK